LACIVGVAIAYFIYADKILNKSQKKIVSKNKSRDSNFRFSDDHGMPLFETSAKDDSKADHVEAIFLTLAHKVRNNKTLFKSGKLLF
jgi:hypothetical protein